MLNWKVFLAIGEEVINWLRDAPILYSHIDNLIPSIRVIDRATELIDCSDKFSFQYKE